jgi:hypothetical protein
MAHPFAAVFAAHDGADVPADLRLQQARDVAQAYGALLERPPEAQGVADCGALPCDKDAIKHALVMLLRRFDEPALREALRIGYLRLADWQPLQLPPATGIDIANARTAGNPLAFAAQLAAARAPLEERRRAAARAERGALLEELRRLGFA